MIKLKSLYYKFLIFFFYMTYDASSTLQNRKKLDSNSVLHCVMVPSFTNLDYQYQFCNVYLQN